MKLILPLCFLIAMCFACESDPVISWESVETSKNLKLVIPELNQQYLSVTARFYSTKQDLLNDVNPFDEQKVFVIIYNTPLIIYSNDIIIDEAYVRLIAQENFGIHKEYFRCEDPIVISKNNGTTVFLLNDSNLILE